MAKYNNYDIDIFPLGDISTEIIQNKLNEIIYKNIIKKNIKCLILIKNFVMNIEFENINIPKIQIILHVKKSINEHIEFIDLPITHFTIGYNKYYYTKLAKFAFTTKINIIDNVFYKETYNRMKKYKSRGYIFVKSIPYGYETTDNQRIISIYDMDYYDTSYILEHKVECKLSDIYKILKNDIILKSLPHDEQINDKLKIEKLISHNARFHSDGLLVSNRKIYNYPSNSNIFLYLYNMNFITNTIQHKRRIKYVKNKHFNKNIYKELDDHHYFESATIIDNITILSSNSKKKMKHVYWDDERDQYIHSYIVYKDIYDAYEYHNNKMNNNENIYLKIITPNEFIKIELKIFFTEYCNYFLNKNKCKKTIDNDYMNIYSKTKEVKQHITSKYIDDDGFILINRKKFK